MQYYYVHVYTAFLRICTYSIPTDMYREIIDIDLFTPPSSTRFSLHTIGTLARSSLKRGIYPDLLKISARLIKQNLG
jgi:hypothetical protein